MSANKIREFTFDELVTWDGEVLLTHLRKALQALKTKVKESSTKAGFTARTS